jgi:hypothetical protein
VNSFDLYEAGRKKLGLEGGGGMMMPARNYSISPKE